VNVQTAPTIVMTVWSFFIALTTAFVGGMGLITMIDVSR
jgi:hypothetical protein